jgi:Flp pilus assembly protein TadB
MPDQETERLKRIREKQLASRDPLVKQRKFQHSSSVKERRMRKPFSFAKAWDDIPHVIKYPFYALIIGVAIIFILPTLWDSPYAFITAIAATVLLIIFGLIMGNSIDLRDDIRRHIK